MLPRASCVHHVHVLGSNFVHQRNEVIYLEIFSYSRKLKLNIVCIGLWVANKTNDIKYDEARHVANRYNYKLIYSMESIEKEVHGNGWGRC